MTGALNKKISAHDPRRERGNDLPRRRSNAYAILVGVRVVTGRALKGSKFLSDRVVCLIIDLVNPHAYSGRVQMDGMWTISP